MFSLRQKIFIISGILLGLVIVVVLYFLVILPDSRKVEPAEVVLPTTTPDIVAEETVRPIVLEAPEILIDSGPPEDSAEQYARQVARIFVERFSSYSNQNENKHIDDVLSLATERMGEWLETLRAKSGDSYLGVTTAVVTSKINLISETAATVKLQVQQTIEDITGIRTEQKTVRVELLGSATDWKVDGVFWE